MNRPRKILFVTLLAIFLIFALAGSVSGQTPDCNPFNADGTVSKTNTCACSDDPAKQSFCMTGTEYLTANLGQMVQKSFFSFAENLAGLFWLLSRWAAMLADFALKGEVWVQIREAILGLLQNIMGGSGGVLDQIVRGTDGLLYIALIIAGIVLILPFAALSGQSPVKLERVVIWGVFLVALFIGGTQGFDMINALEELRVGLMQTIIDSESVQLADLVAAPMLALPEEALTIPEGEPLALPAAYQAQYFPALENAAPWRFRVLVIASNTNLLEVVTAGELVQDADLQERSLTVVAGVIRAGMTLVAAYVLLLVAIILMLLSAAALVLIVFFIAALPLGFFEFGATVLGGLAKQYIGIVTVSLFAAVFVRILGELGGAIFGNDFSLGGMVVYTGGLGIVIIALHAGVKQSWKALSGSADILQTSLASVGAVTGSNQLPALPGGKAVGGALPGGTGDAINTAVTTAAAVGLGAMTGGAGVALAAGMGNVMGGSNAGRSAAAAVATVRPDSQSGQAFAAGAMSRGHLPTLAGGLAIAGRRKNQERDGEAAGKAEHAQKGLERGTTAAQVTLEDQDRLRLAPQWQGTQREGAYLTPDLAALERAEQAYFDEDDEETAARELAHALGDTELAGRVLESYASGGREAATQVRGVVARTQAVAAHSESVVGTDGRLDADYQKERDKLVKGMPGKAASPALRGDLARASVRQVAAVRALPEQERAPVLTRSIVAPADPRVQVGDTAAQYQLHDLAARRGWSAAQVETLFEQEQAAPAIPARERQAQIAEQLQADAAFAGARPPDLNEAGRLAALVSETAYLQVPAGGWGERAGEQESRGADVPEKHGDDAQSNISDEILPDDFPDETGDAMPALETSEPELIFGEGSTRFIGGDLPVPPDGGMPFTPDGPTPSPASADPHPERDKREESTDLTHAETLDEPESGEPDSLSDLPGGATPATPLPDETGDSVGGAIPVTPEPVAPPEAPPVSSVVSSVAAAPETPAMTPDSSAAQGGAKSPEKPQTTVRLEDLARPEPRPIPLSETGKKNAPKENSKEKEGDV